MHSCLDRAGKASSQGFQYIIHEELMVLIGNELTKNNGCFTAHH